MDAFNFLLSILLIFLALQYGQNWMVFAILIISVLTVRELVSLLALLVATAVIYAVFAPDQIKSYYPLIGVALLIITLIVGLGKKPPSQPEYYPPDLGYGDMGDAFGGYGGY